MTITALDAGRSCAKAGIDGAANRQLRIGIVGARARHQGIGEHVAKHFAALGQRVTAIAGSSSNSVAVAREHLQQTYGIAARGYASVASLLENEPLDAVAICSPDRFHREHLEAALSRGVHILCEKPLVFEPGREPAADAAPLLAIARSSGKVLMVNEQWPYTLPTFETLYPAAKIFEHPPRRLSMWLSPSVAGAAMIPNSVPHLLSLVWVLCPAGGTIENLTFQSHDAAGTSITIAFTYSHTAGTTLVSLALRQALSQPRSAGFAIDERKASRVVEMSPYGFFLQAAGDGDAHGNSQASRQQVRMPDPLASLAADFVRRVERCEAGEPPWQDTTLLERLQALGQIAQAADDYFASSCVRSTDELT